MANYSQAFKMIWMEIKHLVMEESALHQHSAGLKQHVCAQLMMASPKNVNKAMAKADSLDSAHWLASTTPGVRTNPGFQKRSHVGGSSNAGGAGSFNYAPMDLG